eukprot:2819601-Lingulodinium_polyedra.AAC.1
MSEAGTAGNAKKADNHAGIFILWKQSFTSAIPRVITVSRRARRPASLDTSIPSGSCTSTFPNPSPVSNSTPGASRKRQFERL